MDKAKIMKEYFNTLISCSSAPLSGNDDSNAKYLMGKIEYFRQNEIPEDLLADLEMQIIIHCTKYYEKNFESFLSFMKNRTIAITKAIEAVSIKNYEKILKISEPALKYIEKKIEEVPEAINIGKEHEAILFSITNNCDKPARIIGDDWDKFFCMFIKLSLDKRYAALNKKPLGNLGRYVECALKLCPVNAEVIYFSALYYGIIGQTAKAEDLIKKALACSCNNDTLAACYVTLATYYAEKQDMKTTCSLLDIAKEYSDKPIAYPGVSAEMMKSLLFPMQKSNYVYSDVLLKEKIQIGFSSNVNLTAHILKNNTTHYQNNIFVQTVLGNTLSGVKIEHNFFVKNKSRYAVLLLSESKCDEKYLFNVDRVYSIGRQNDNDIVFNNDRYMSRKHCYIFQENSKLYLKNIGKNNVFYNKDMSDIIELTSGRMKLGHTTIDILVYKLS